MSEFFGYHLMLDCSGCDTESMKNYNVCYNFVKELVPSIGMVAVGEPVIEYLLVDDPKQGYSIMQLISTSSIVGHLMDLDGTAYFDVFSCRKFDVNTAQDIVSKYFSPKKMRVNFITRDAN